ncbi:flagellar assembly protein FliH [Paenibacillus sp. IB182496]|uniref:Flagellar assembly protein FliH n=1 Tax=Paenibacillus sabuli TaxID=2772509 RepID=A0A927BTL3_9BACL|nr:flagellar assembly protein FliH [Paenibacillus sabuli]
MSNLFKATRVISMEELKKLQWDNRYAASAAETDDEPAEAQGPDAETLSMRDRILGDAESVATERIEQAGRQAEQQLAEAREQIEQWWADKRAQDEDMEATAKHEGYEQGREEGIAQGEAENAASWEASLTESRQLLEQARRTREQIIQEAEPFLLELSCAIAAKIIGRELEQDTSLALELIRKSLARRHEQGLITVCVAPSQLAFVQAARDELAAVVDSQAQLQILPDAAIQDQGCVIRSAYGSIDARIDTQLEEIKRELMQLALQQAEGGEPDEPTTA